MAETIKILELNSNEFTIAPIVDRFSTDNSVQIEALKEELKKLDLHAGDDYQIQTVSILHPHLRQIKFQGKSLVLRALWTIPDAMFDFRSSSCNKADFNKFKLVCATDITNKQCIVHDEKFIHKAYAELYDFVLEKVRSVHSPEAKQTSVMERLDKDLAFIGTLQEDIWLNPKAYLALAALVKAYTDEKAKPTLVKPGLSIFAKDSLLLPKYKDILETFCRIKNWAFDKILVALIPTYNQHVSAKQLAVAATATATAAAGAADAKAQPQPPALKK